jgi:hypothetical protein
MKATGRRLTCPAQISLCKDPSLALRMTRGLILSLKNLIQPLVRINHTALHA